MSRRIKVLDKKTINQIAAGEVIERPASVVKELLENAIDAHSTKIIIELEHVGVKLIRVTDNGDGIAPEDLKLAFEKHSTSKISMIDDIYRLFSLGFRGEALASIAAVARVECITSDGKDITGRKIVIDGGVVRSLSEIGCPKGTTVKVRELFHNLPARYKYLKSNQTELAHIIDIVTHLAIYYHKISFNLIHDGNEIMNLPVTKNRLDNLVNIYGKELVRNLIPISGEVEINETKSKEILKDHAQAPVRFNITGYIGKPSTTRSDSSYQSIFVNGRYVETRTISNAIREAYRTLVMKHRYPVVILFINTNPEAVDVNIHPTKLQVRFENEKQVYNAVFKAIKGTLHSHDLIPEAKVTSKPQTVSLKAITTLGIGKPGYFSPLPTTTTTSKQGSQKVRPKISPRQTVLKPDTKKHTTAIAPMDKIASFRPSNNMTAQDASTQPHLPESSQSFIQPIGQILNTYIIAQAGEGMLIIDQHAAHERIMYEKIKHRYSESSMSTQELLEPVELELSPKEQGLLKANLDTLQDLNFTIDEMGNNSYFVKGIPIILGRLQQPEFIHDIINDLITVTKEKESELIKEKMIQIMACKSAIKAGKPLTIPEIQQLIFELYSIENPYTCAHGRPTIISVTETQLKKLFKRII